MVEEFRDMPAADRALTRDKRPAQYWQVWKSGSTVRVPNNLESDIYTIQFQKAFERGSGEGYLVVRLLRHLAVSRPDMHKPSPSVGDMPNSHRSRCRHGQGNISWIRSIHSSIDAIKLLCKRLCRNEVSSLPSRPQQPVSQLCCPG